VRRFIAARALSAAAAAAFAFDPVPLPASVARDLPQLAVSGSHRFRFLGFHVYDATLWTPGGRGGLEGAFALDIRYARHFSGRDLARRSIEEMRKQGLQDEAALARWAVEMERVFPDIRDGDRLFGVHVPGIGARFHAGERITGLVEDPAFARAFFAIWLGERTTQPAMRRALLGPDKR
jgi:hypothetical protein